MHKPCSPPSRESLAETRSVTYKSIQIQESFGLLPRNERFAIVLCDRLLKVSLVFEILLDLPCQIVEKRVHSPRCRGHADRESPPLDRFQSSVVRQADCSLFSLALPRLTFSRISEAAAVQMKGDGFSL